MIKRLVRIFGVLILVSMLFTMISGCGDVKKVLTSDGKLQIEIPNGWKESSDTSNKDAILSVTSSDKAIAIIVISDNKPKDAKDHKLSDYYKLVATNMVKSSQNAKITNPLGVIKKQHDTIQFQFDNKVNSKDVTYLVTLIDAKDKYYQLIGWTGKPIFSNVRGQIESIVNSFKVIGE